MNESAQNLTKEAHTDKNLCMRGKVKTREKCPECHIPFKATDEAVYCDRCGRHPDTYFIFLYHEGKKHRIARDTDGHILDSYKRAYRLLENIRKDIDDGIFSVVDYIPKERKSFNAGILLDKWLTTKKDLSPYHIRDTKQYLRIYYKPFFKSMNARQIRTHHIEDFYLQLPEHLSLKTKKNIMTMLKNFILWLHNREVLIRKPQFPIVSPPEPVIQWISKEDQLKVLEQLHPHHRPIFEFLIFHPVRPGEARALKAKDFNLQDMTVHICRTWCFKELRSRKNKKPYYLPISQHFDISELKGKLPEAFVFINKMGRPYLAEGLRKVWHKARVKAGLPNISLYNATRHSIASQAVNYGIDLAIVSKALGHSTLEMTKKYASMNTQILRNVVDGAQLVQISKKQNCKSVK